MSNLTTRYIFNSVQLAMLLVVSFSFLSFQKVEALSSSDIKYVVAPQMDNDGWIYADSATVSFACQDDAGVVDCPDLVIVTESGETVIEKTLHDTLGNTTTVSVVVRLAKVFTPVLQPSSPLSAIKTPLGESTAGWGDLAPVATQLQPLPAFSVSAIAAASIQNNTAATSQNVSPPAISLPAITAGVQQLSGSAFSTSVPTPQTQSVNIQAPAVKRVRLTWLHMLGLLLPLFGLLFWLLLKHKHSR